MYALNAISTCCNLLTWSIGGNCYQITYSGKSVYMLAIDHAADGVNMSFEAMDDLTDGQADFLGRIDATVTLTSASNCGL